MAVLTDYIDAEDIKELESLFLGACGFDIRVCNPSGRPIGDEPSDDAEAEDEPAVGSPDDGAAVVVAGQIVARVCLIPCQQPAEAKSLDLCAKTWQDLLAAMVGRLCAQRHLLRTRVAELGTLYRLTAEFTGEKDLQSVLDLVASTVMRVLEAKACAIRLLNEQRDELVIKAVANLSPEYLDKGPILLSDSKIDREVLQSRKPVYIADSRTDPRVLYPAEANREGIVSALCAPMVYKGRCEGVLRVYTADIHEFDWFEISLLTAIAANAAAAIANARLYGEAIRGENMRRHIRLAGMVQRRMIPSAPPITRGFDISGLYVPCFDLGGDFYDFIQLPNDNLGLAICDVVGKGVRASILMSSLRASLRAHATAVYDISDVLDRVNTSLCADTLSSDFATMFYAVLDLQSRRLTYANAGHPPPLLLRDGEFRNLSTGGGALGIYELTAWKHDMLACRSGDVILAYTDGLSEAMNFSDEEFGAERIRRAMLAAVDGQMDADGILKHVLWEMRRFAGLQNRLDDVTMLVIRAL